MVEFVLGSCMRMDDEKQGRKRRDDDGSRMPRRYLKGEGGRLAT
jgi:hypothetical protein